MLRRWIASRPGKSGIAEAQELGRRLEAQIDTDTRSRIKDMAAILEDLAPGWQKRLDDGAAYVMHAAQLRCAIRSVQQTGFVAEPPGLHFQISSLFLRDARNYLVGDAQGCERLALISGTITGDGVRVLSRIIHVPMDKASAAYVRADPGVTHKTVVDLVERDGHPLLGMWHSHIMDGQDCTHPSGIDIANQERFCAMGWDEVIGGIFSLDGYVRLFSTARDFTVSVYGNGAGIVTDTPREKVLRLAAGA